MSELSIKLPIINLSSNITSNLLVFKIIVAIIFFYDLLSTKIKAHKFCFQVASFSGFDQRLPSIYYLKTFLKKKVLIMRELLLHIFLRNKFNTKQL